MIHPPSSRGVILTLLTASSDRLFCPHLQGALLAFECLSDKLGRLFEPYIIYILPLLLNCYGDAVPQVNINER